MSQQCPAPATSTAKACAIVATLAAVLLLAPVPVPAFQVMQQVEQAEARDTAGRITQEHSVIHVVACNGAGENGQQFYIYQYLNRPGFRAIRPPNWSTAIGGSDFPAFGQAVGAACGITLPIPSPPTGGSPGPAGPQPPTPGPSELPPDLRPEDL
jgi:hypothetical protein